MARSILKRNALFKEHLVGCSSSLCVQLYVHRCVTANLKVFSVTRSTDSYTLITSTLKRQGFTFGHFELYTLPDARAYNQVQMRIKYLFSQIFNKNVPISRYFPLITGHSLDFYPMTQYALITFRESS